MTKAVYRTALATPGLSIIVKKLLKSLVYVDLKNQILERVCVVLLLLQVLLRHAQERKLLIYKDNFLRSKEQHKKRNGIKNTQDMHPHVGVLIKIWWKKSLERKQRLKD